MTATYTYNDAIDDATRVVVKAWDSAGDDLLEHMPLMLKIVGDLNELKRRRRRRGRPPALEQ